MQDRVKVAVAGAGGRMGRQVLRAVLEDTGTDLVGAVDPAAEGADAGVLAGLGDCRLPVLNSLSELLAQTQPEVLVDFTIARVAAENALLAIARGVSPVIGTTGLPADRLQAIREAAEKRQVGTLLAPNFAIGAVLMMLFARQAARYMPEVEVIELHHEKKVDAPSGTAMRTVDLILEGRGERTVTRPSEEDIRVPGSRGGDRDGVRIHSVRLPGYVAHQEVIFGGLGQTLTIRHDSIDRASFMPGVIMACKRIRAHQGLIVGLEHLLEL